MAYSPQNEPPTWRGITDVHAVVVGLMAADRGAELGVSIPSGDPDSAAPPSDTEGMESDDTPAGDGEGDDEASSQVDATPEGGEVAAAGSDVPLEDAGGDVSTEGDVADEPGESPIQVDDDVPELSVPDSGTEDAGELELGDGEGDQSPRPVDDPVAGRDRAEDASDAALATDDQDDANLQGGIEFESSITPEPWKWEPEDNAPNGWGAPVQVPDHLELPTSDIEGYGLLDRQGGYD